MAVVTVVALTVAALLSLTVLAVAGGARPCRHDWQYGRKSVGGWGVVRCRNCGQEDLY